MALDPHNMGQIEVPRKIRNQFMIDLRRVGWSHEKAASRITSERINGQRLTNYLRGVIVMPHSVQTELRSILDKKLKKLSKES